MSSSSECSSPNSVTQAAQRARHAACVLAVLPTAQKNHLLECASRALRANIDRIVESNTKDIDLAHHSGLNPTMVDRLLLTPARLEDMARGLDQISQLADPIGEVIRGYTLPNGLRLRQQRVPLGVIGVVYEGRPNVTVDVFGLTFKSGNAALLRGSSSAIHSNTVLVEILQEVLINNDLPVEAVQLLDSTNRASVTELIQARGLVDVVIPRGGAGLIDAVVRNAYVPTIETGVGNCHVYVHRDADINMATTIVLNAKTRRPSVCNAAETLLVDRAIASQGLPILLEALQRAGVVVHGAESGCASPEDFAREYLSMDIALRVVDDLDQAIEHIRTYGTGHTEAIITENLAAAQEFVDRVDAAAVMVNASTAFTDGQQFGFGAEIGISTQKLHARGPMGLAELTSTKWIVWGQGQTRPAS